MKDLNEYQQLASRTMRMEDGDRMKLHCIVGMAGELGELWEAAKKDDGSEVGELGDCLWYAANLCQILKVDMQEVPQVVLDGLGDYWSGPEQLAFSSTRMLELAKKQFFYGKEYPIKELKLLLASYIQAVLSLTKHLGHSVLDVAEVNILKLEKRYPDLRFDASHAINRDYEAESKASGQKIA